MTTIDHKAEALMILNHGTVVSAETEALVHATLYLAEQTRIANIIALGNPQDLFNGGTVRIPSYDRDGNLRPDIARALGLDKEDAS